MPIKHTTASAFTVIGALLIVAFSACQPQATTQEKTPVQDTLQSDSDSVTRVAVPVTPPDSGKVNKSDVPKFHSKDNGGEAPGSAGRGAGPNDPSTKPRRDANADRNTSPAARDTGR